MSNCYTYDNDGNLTTQASPGVSTTMTYDQLHRLLTKSYTDGTPQATYVYDTVQTGCLSSVGNSVSSTSFTYGPACQVKTSTQNTSGTPYEFSYGYNLAGAMTKELYPSGRIVTTNYDIAARPTSLTGLLGATNSTYISSVAYGPYGLPTSMVYGNTIAESRGYNDRLQITSISAGAFSLVNTFSTATNNGNIVGQTVNGASRSYSYDNLNRLTSVVNGSTWSETYGYDRYGNRAVIGRTGLPGLTAETPTVLSAYNTGSNRIGSFSYDGRGNVTNMATRTATYDGENHQISVTPAGAGQPTHTYQYDGQGQRVKKTVGGVTTIFVYDATGELAAEYGGTVSGSGTHFLTADHLGSTRRVTDANGQQVSGSDYLPFGEEIGGACLSLAGGVNGSLPRPRELFRRRRC